MAPSSWQERLRTVGHAVVHGVALDDDNAALRALGAQLGTASFHGARPGMPNVEGHGVSSIQALDRPVLDPAGRVVLSTSPATFRLHTDDTFSRTPARWVLMHCWYADPAGGDSLLAHVDDVLPRLPADMVRRLEAADFPSPDGPAPVLFGGADVVRKVRFNHRDFVGYGERFGPALAPDQLRCLDAVLLAAEAVSLRLRLETGDCLVVDNHRVLHGRTAFAAGSGRLLKRLRIQ
jgi:alpha-ketoglutarate-dependent taurine dioxygenase